MPGEGHPYCEYKNLCMVSSTWSHRGSTYYIAEGTSVLYLETVVVTRAGVFVELSKPEPKTKRAREKKISRFTP